MKNNYTLYSLLFVFALSLTIISCKKDPELEEEVPVEENNEIPTEIKPEAIVTDTTSVLLLSTSTDIDSGIIIYEYSGTPSIQSVGDVLIDQRGEGFIRKVLSSQVNGNTITYTTEQARLTDVFVSGSGSYSSDLKAGWTYNMVNEVIYSSPGVEVTVNGSMTFNPNLNLDFDIEDGALSFLDCSVQNAPFTVNASATATLNGAAQLVNFEKTIATITKRGVFWIGIVPVVVVYQTDLVATANVDASSQTVGTVSSSYTSNIDASLNYTTAGGWNSSFNASGGQLDFDVTGSSVVTLDVGVDITPRVTVKLYGVAGPELSSTAYLDYTKSVAINSNWNETLVLGVNGEFVVDATILDVNIFNYSKGFDLLGPWQIDRPAAISLISGNNQMVDQNMTTPDALTVRVVDSESDPVQNVQVNWEVTQGDGSVTSATSTTNSAGDATNTFAMGSTSTNKVQAKILKADGSIIGSPIEFNIDLGQSAPPLQFGTNYSFVYPDCVTPDSAYIQLQVSGGTLPYSFSVNNGVSWYNANIGTDGFFYGPPFFGMPSCGTYECVVIDNAGGSVHDTIRTTINLQP